MNRFLIIIGYSESKDVFVDDHHKLFLKWKTIMGVFEFCPFLLRLPALLFTVQSENSADWGLNCCFKLKSLRFDDGADFLFLFSTASGSAHAAFKKYG